MALLLEPDRYPSVRTLFEGMNYHLAAMTVLAGTLPGRIYVDDAASPATAVLIPSNRHRVYASGVPEPRLLADVLQLLFAESGEESQGFVVYYDTTRPWKAAIEEALRNQEVSAEARQYYRLRGPTAPVVGPLPDQIAVARIDEAMAGDATLVNSDALLEEIQSESPSLEHFLRRNFGFCAQDGRQLVAWCLAEYHEGSRYELGIETSEAYQRRGLATHLAAVVIGHAFERGATEIGWHCWAGNAPSVATAVKLGFEKVADYPVYYCLYRQVPA